MLFGSSGIRRKFDQELADTALRVGSALAGLPKNEIVVGMDCRTTSPLIARIVTAGILGNGGSALFCGTVPTPTVAYHARHAGAGCMITASHNPEEYNGLKLFNPDGSSFTKQQRREMEGLIGNCHWQDWRHQGDERFVDALSPHKAAILNNIRLNRDISVILDCGNGAGCSLSPTLLREAGATVVTVNTNPSGRFARPSEPLEENLKYIGDLVKKTNADAAVVHDGDADRMMAFDNKGRYIKGDHLLMLFTRYLGAKRVVTTSDASMIIEQVADVHRTPVGDAYVSEELLSWGDFGGEPSGAWIFPNLSLCPDGPFAAALFCEIASQWDVAAEIDAMPSYPLLRESVLTPAARETVTSLGAENPTDGIRIEEEGGWCLIRASGTEPKIRITAEGTTLQVARSLLAKGRDLIRQGKTA